jgi:hypothetical protein
MKKVTLIVVGILAAVGIVGFLSPVSLALDCNNPATAAEQSQCAVNAAETGSATSGKTNGNTLASTIGTVIDVMLFIVGILCVIMIIYGGISYVMSASDSNKIKKARDTIVYAVVGLIVAILGFALVNWVVGSLSGGSSAAPTEAECQKKGSKWHLDASAKKCVEVP